jgi:hypothetical protein
MSFDRILLAVLASFVFLAGVGSLLAPAVFAERADYSTTPSALTEVRAFYGGLQIGIGLFLAWCVRAADRTSQGLLLSGLAVGGAGLGRMFGLLVDQTPTSHHLANLGIEAVTLVLVVIALSSVYRRSTQSVV